MAFFFFITVGSYSNSLLLIYQNSKYGFVDTFGSVVIQPQFDFAKEFKENRAEIGKISEPSLDTLASGSSVKYGFIDNLGEFTASLIYDEVKGYKNGYARVRIGQKWGYIDYDGKLVISLIFDDA